MAANKVAGVRAALVWSEETAELSRRHNDANVISVGARMHPVETTTTFVEIFLSTAFTGEERHARRVQMITDYEATGQLPPLPESGSSAGQPA